MSAVRITITSDGEVYETLDLDPDTLMLRDSGGAAIMGIESPIFGRDMRLLLTAAQKWNDDREDLPGSS